MSKTRWVFILGIWVMILPFLGFPRVWKNTLFVITGLGLIYLAYLLRREKRRVSSQVEPKIEKPDTFTDNGEEVSIRETSEPKDL